VAARQTSRQGGGGRRGGKPDNTVFIARARQSTARPLSAARSLVVDQSRARVPADHGLGCAADRNVRCEDIKEGCPSRPVGDRRRVAVYI